MDSKAPEDDKEHGARVQVLRDGRYAVTGMLGEGSQGQTLEAVDKRDGCLVAIKRFSIKGASSWKDVELAEREARVLSRLDHPALPRYIEHFEEGGALYLVMERVEGRTLAELSRAGQLDQHAVVRLLNDIADVLDYLHFRSPPLIHRDIKPSNIIVRLDGGFALVDFGSVRDRLRPEGGSTVVGTFGYMAPEQFQGRALPVTDIYGAGATALSVLTKSEPDQLPHRGLAIDVRRALGGQVDARLGHVLEAMLAPDPDTRAPNLAQLLEAQRLRMGPTERDPKLHEPAYQARVGRASSHPGAPSQRSPRGRSFAVHGLNFGGQRLHHRFDPWLFRNAFVVPVLLLALEIAKLATWALFGIVLPVLFGVLSLFFGRPLRRAAVRMDSMGQRGRQAISEAGRRLAERADGAAARRHERRQQRRVRVHDRKRVSHEAASTPSSLSEEVPPDKPRVARR